MNGENPRLSKTLYCRGECKHSFKRRLRTESFPVHWLGGYAMLMSPNEGETAVHGWYCPGDMAVRVCEVLARPWVGVCVPRFNIIIESWFDYCFFKNYTFHKSTSEFCFFLLFFVRVHSHLVPPGTGARVRYSLGTNVNTTLFSSTRARIRARCRCRETLYSGTKVGTGHPSARVFPWFQRVLPTINFFAYQ